MQNAAFTDKRYRAVIGFLASRGLLLVRGEFERQPMLNVADALYVAEHAEPRVLEVLAAAILRFPKQIRRLGALPVELMHAVEKLRVGQIPEGEYRGISFQSMARWLNCRLPDGRTVPFNQRKRAKSFRLKPSTIALLEEGAKKAGVNETELLEKLLHEGLCR